MGMLLNDFYFAVAITFEMIKDHDESQSVKKS